MNKYLADCYDAALRENADLKMQLARAKALLRDAREGLDEHWVTTDVGKDAVARIDAFLASDSSREA